MSFFSDLVSVEGLFRFCQVTAWIAGALTVLALIGKDVTQRIIAERQALAITEARNRQVAAEAGLGRAVKDLDERETAARIAAEVQWYGRIIKMQCLTTGLSGKPPKDVSVRVLYQKEDARRPQAFAHKIWLSLSITGWPLAASSEEPWENNSPVDIVTSIVTASGKTGLFISPRTGNEAITEGSPEYRLVQALSKCGAHFETIRPSSDDMIFLIVRPAPPPPTPSPK